MKPDILAPGTLTSAAVGDGSSQDCELMTMAVRLTANQYLYQYLSVSLNSVSLDPSLCRVPVDGHMHVACLFIWVKCRPVASYFAALLQRFTARFSAPFLPACLPARLCAAT